MQAKPLHILVSPLDWGLGHASRCIPIIQQLNQVGHEITIAGHGRSLILLQKEFPLLKSIEFQGFSPNYSRSGNMVLALLFLLPQFISKTWNEHKFLKKLIAKHNFDVIISDNRYGLWHKKTKSILITHQVMIKTPGWLRFAEYIIYRVSRMLISRFDECWIPDTSESPGLSGDLSHKYSLPENAVFIGPLSRFEQSDTQDETHYGKENIAVIISGPEPQRSIFKKLVTKQLKELKLSATIMSGKPESEKPAVIDGNLTILPHLDTEAFRSVINSSALVICRSGYTSIMDLRALGAKALFVPTPGQTEQIYLAELHQNTATALYRSQDDLNLKSDISEALTYTGFNNKQVWLNLITAIGNLKKK